MNKKNTTFLTKVFSFCAAHQYGNDKWSLNLKKNGELYKRSTSSQSESYGNGASESLSVQLECEVGDYFELDGYVSSVDLTNQDFAGKEFAEFNGHMISSITEGEVKEKEAVVFKGNVNGQTVTDNVFSQIE